MNRFVLLLLLMNLACGKETMFTSVPVSHSGLEFANRIAMDDSMNLVSYMYFFNGGGVAVADLDNDGWEDLLLTGNQTSSRAYRNQTSLRFDDVTKLANLETEGWCTGVSVADVDNDGLLDIYICRAGHPEPEQRTNLCFHNRGDWHFQEVSQEWGLGDTSYTTQAAWFDYDRDGDLDVYLLNHDHQFRGTNVVRRRKGDGTASNTDRLYQNLFKETGKIKFVDVSQEAGINWEGFGLGIDVSDVNRDGWPDVYVANDFLSSDLLYLNQKNGSFVNVLDSMILHHSYNGMGCAVEDVDNDTWPDIFVADMLPRQHDRRQLMSMNSITAIEEQVAALGYNVQYARNTLQLHQGMLDGISLPMTEVAQQVGLEATDWSWSPVWGDFDRNGWKDLIISTGYLYDVTNQDFIARHHQYDRFSTQAFQDSIYLQLLQDLPALKAPDHIFANAAMQFEDMTRDWGLALPTITHGLAAADLDNDGDLDLVMNHLNQTMTLWQNNIRNGYHLLIELYSEDPAEGSMVTVWTDEVQSAELMPVSGYQSCQSRRLFFGIPDEGRIDSIEVQWAGGDCERWYDIEFGSLHLEKGGGASCSPPRAEPSPLLLEEADWFSWNDQAFDEKHVFDRHPRPFSTTAPALAHDHSSGQILVGGSVGQPANLYFPESEGMLRSVILPGDSVFCDVDAVFFDLDGDHDQDLYLVSGGARFDSLSSNYGDRLYENRGEGVFTLLHQTTLHANGSIARTCDFDHDGDVDVFVGGSVQPFRYPLPDRSVLWANQAGQLVDVTEGVTGLSKSGIINDAAWADLNGDGYEELILAGDWMAPTIYHNASGELRPTVPDWLGYDDPLEGWWQSVEAVDFDQDGDLDLLFGNYGENSVLGNRALTDLVCVSGMQDGLWISHLGRRNQLSGQVVPLFSRDAFLRQHPVKNGHFPSYAAFAGQTMEDLFADMKVERRSVDCLASVLLENLGDFNFRIHRLPDELQRGPIVQWLVLDLNGDQQQDIIGLGGEWKSGSIHERQDAMVACVGISKVEGMMWLDPMQSGFYPLGDARKMVQLSSQPASFLVLFEGQIARRWTARGPESY